MILTSWVASTTEGRGGLQLHAPINPDAGRPVTQDNDDTLYDVDDLLRRDALGYAERKRLQVLNHLTGEHQEFPRCSL